MKVGTRTVLVCGLVKQIIRQGDSLVLIAECHHFTGQQVLGLINAFRPFVAQEGSPGHVEIIGIGRLPGRCQQAFVVEWSHLVNGPQELVRLLSSGIIMAGKDPLELSAQAVSVLIGHRQLGMEQCTLVFFAPGGIAGK